MTSRERERREMQFADTSRRVKEHGAGWEPTTFKVPEGMLLFKFKKAGTFLLDIAAYKVGKTGLQKYADPGFYYYEQSFKVHQGLGPDGRQSVCCLVQTFNRKKCPGCDEANRVNREINKEAASSLWARERQLFYLRDGTTSEDFKKGIQIFETAYKGGQGYKGFGEYIDVRIKKAKNENFWYPDKKSGRTLEVTVVERKYKQLYYSADDIELVERGDDWDEKEFKSLLKDLPPLDELLIEMSYDEFYSLIHGSDPEDNGEAPRGGSIKGAKSRSVSMPPPEDDIDDNDTGDDESVDDDDMDPGTPDPDLDDDQVEVGDTVTWHSKGKKYTGEVKKIYNEDDEASVLVHNEQKPRRVLIGDLTINEKGKSSEDDEDLDDEPKSPTLDDDEDPFSDEVENKDDIGFDEDETFDDEPETPVKKTTAKKPPQRGRR